MPRLLTAFCVASAFGVLVPAGVVAQQSASAREVTFSKDIAPILQRSCQNCHRPNQVAPMSLITLSLIHI